MNFGSRLGNLCACTLLLSLYTVPQLRSGEGAWRCRVHPICTIGKLARQIEIQPLYECPLKQYIIRDELRSLAGASSTCSNSGAAPVCRVEVNARHAIDFSPRRNGIPLLPTPYSRNLLSLEKETIEREGGIWTHLIETSISNEPMQALPWSVGG